MYSRNQDKFGSTQGDGVREWLGIVRAIQLRGKNGICIESELCNDVHSDEVQHGRLSRDSASMIKWYQT